MLFQDKVEQAIERPLIFHGHFHICHLKINNTLLYTVALTLKGHPPLRPFELKYLMFAQGMFN